MKTNNPNTPELNNIIKQILDEMLGLKLSKPTNLKPEELDYIKRKILREKKFPTMPSNSNILNFINKHRNKKGYKRYQQLKKYFIKKPMRTGSGVTPVAVMIKPEGSCKHNCVYCPFTGKAAKSYTGEEPAALRARANNFDPYKQVKARLKQYEETGHDTTKIELIVMGGTFLEMNSAYKSYFIKSLFDALNGMKSENISDAIKTNEKTKHRCVGLTIETRPDVCSRDLINEMLSFGTTRVELGVQNPNDEIYKKIKRGHNVNDVVEATQNLRDAGIKVLYHIMLGLPGSNPKKDIQMIKNIFSDKRFKPDMIKIYPTLLIKNTELYSWYLKGVYKPYTSEMAADVIAESYKYIPKYVRVMRIQRDIPANLIEDGVKKSNLRQLVWKKMDEKKIIPKEIRWREIGNVRKRNKLLNNAQLNKLLNPDSMKIDLLKYETLGGMEYFISYENEEADALAGFIRLRIPEDSWKCKQIHLDNCGFIRELHVYGEETPLGLEGEAQHRGIGSKLLRKAEEIAKENGVKHLLIQSGIGVREYYRKRGYKLLESYMHKEL